MEGHLRHAAALDPDRRQDPAGPDPVAQPFLARRALCHAARADHVAHSLWRSQLPARVRLSRPCAARLDQRRRQAGGRALSAHASLISMPNVMRALCRARHRRPHRRACPTNARRDPLQPGRVHASYDPRFRARLLAHPAAVEPGCCTGSAPPFIGKCSPVHFFWGSFDLAVTRFSGRRAPLHPAPAACRICPRRGARRLFARGQQRRLLARQGRGSIIRPSILTPVPAPAGFARRIVRPAQAVLERGSPPIYPALRRGSHRRAIRSRP